MRSEAGEGAGTRVIRTAERAVLVKNGRDGGDSGSSGGGGSVWRRAVSPLWLRERCGGCAHVPGIDRGEG